MWVRMGLEHEVAVYARRLTEFECKKAPANRGTIVRQGAKDLGISLKGMARHRWKISADEVAPKRDALMSAGSVKARLRAAGPDRAS